MRTSGRTRTATARNANVHREKCFLAKGVCFRSKFLRNITPMSHQSSHPTPHYLRFGPKFGVTVKKIARAATAARVTKRNAIERELWLGQFEVYSSFGYLGVFIGCRLSSRWSLMCCNGRNGCGNGPVFRGKVRRGVCFRSKFLATENAARGLFLNRISRKS